MAFHLERMGSGWNIIYRHIPLHRRTFSLFSIHRYGEFPGSDRKINGCSRVYRDGEIQDKRFIGYQRKPGPDITPDGGQGSLGHGKISGTGTNADLSKSRFGRFNAHNFPGKNMCRRSTPGMAPPVVRLVFVVPRLGSILSPMPTCFPIVS